MTTKELAVALRCHPKTIRKIVKDGLIDATPIGGSKGFDFEPDAPEIIRAMLKSEHERKTAISNRKRIKTLARKASRKS